MKRIFNICNYTVRAIYTQCILPTKWAKAVFIGNLAISNRTLYNKAISAQGKSALLLKEELPKNVSNFLTIEIVSKVFERLMQKQVNNFIETFITLSLWLHAYGFSKDAL